MEWMPVHAPGGRGRKWGVRGGIGGSCTAAAAVAPPNCYRCPPALPSCHSLRGCSITDDKLLLLHCFGVMNLLWFTAQMSSTVKELRQVLPFLKSDDNNTHLPGHVKWFTFYGFNATKQVQPRS